MDFNKLDARLYDPFYDGDELAEAMRNVFSVDM